ncbi:Apc15p protein-domain-containing protein [Hypoxylon cercidicola]|nr:Apc15p protein-domain-containing protein [Hypoxylon cercidicola]
MFSLLPDLAPRDSHALWYTSTRNPISPPYHDAAYLPNHQQQQQHQQHDAGANGHQQQQRRGGGGAHLIERSRLARLRADEANVERRRQNVALFGSAWLKPVGVPKTLHQMREERREAEEHQEALRREQLAQELAEAEAAGVGGADNALDGDDAQAGAGGPGLGGGVDEDGAMDDVQLDGARDLDDDIPEAEDTGFGIDSSDEEEEDDDEDDDDEEEENADGPEQRAAHAQQQLMQQRMRQADDAFRESMARGRDSTHYYGVDEEVDDEDQAQMIEEDDLVGHGGMDMEADLDDDIPEAEDEGYEHTDSEAEMSSDDDDRAEMSFAAHASQPARPPRHSHARSDATRHSLAISDLLSHDGSSMLGSSPEALRRGSGIRRLPG